MLRKLLMIFVWISSLTAQAQEILIKVSGRIFLIKAAAEIEIKEPISKNQFIDLLKQYEVKEVILLPDGKFKLNQADYLRPGTWTETDAKVGTWTEADARVIGTWTETDAKLGTWTETEAKKLDVLKKNFEKNIKLPSISEIVKPADFTKNNKNGK